MSMKIKQIRYFGKYLTQEQELGLNNSNLSISNDNIAGAISDSIKGFTPIKKLGIQTMPGVQFSLNDNVDGPIIIGPSGIFELDLTNSTASISNISFDADN